MPRQQPQYPGAQEYIGHSHFWAGRGKHAVRYIIIHGTAWPGRIDAVGIARFFAGTSRDTGTHYVIDKQGVVVQCCREEDSAWGNGGVEPGHDPWWGVRGNPNLETISIEHVKWQTDASGTPDNSDSLTPAQQEASFALIAYLVRKWAIPPRWADAAGGITGHFSMQPITRKHCPGPYPWEDLFHSLVAPADTPLLPQYRPSLALRSVDLTGAVLDNTATQGNLGTQEGSAPRDISLKSAGTQAHEALSELPGFLGIVQAVDASEQFQRLRITGPADIFGWLGANLFAFMVRLVLIGLGVLLLFGLIASVARENEWIGQAGGDVLPVALPT